MTKGKSVVFASPVDVRTEPQDDDAQDTESNQEKQEQPTQTESSVHVKKKAASKSTRSRGSRNKQADGDVSADEKSTEGAPAPEQDAGDNKPGSAEADDTAYTGPDSATSVEEETAGHSPRMIPRNLARTTIRHDARFVQGGKSRKDRIRRRSKPPRQKKDQLNGRVVEFVIFGLRDWCDKQGITEVGEGMTLLIETMLREADPDTIANAYADWCVENGYYEKHEEAKERYLNGTE